jgi:hypothetical protein
LVGGRNVGSAVSLARKDDNVAAGTVAIEVQRDTRVALDVREPFGAGQ